jgi:hypothetical protein
MENSWELISRDHSSILLGIFLIFWVPSLIRALAQACWNTLEYFFTTTFNINGGPWQELIEGFCLGTLDVEGSPTYTFSTQEAKETIQHKEQSNSKSRLKITSWLIVIYVGEV